MNSSFPSWSHDFVSGLKGEENKQKETENSKPIIKAATSRLELHRVILEFKFFAFKFQPRDMGLPKSV